MPNGWLVVSLVTVAFSTGGALYWFREARQARRARGHAERFGSEIVDNLHGGFVVVGAGGVIRQANEKFGQLVGVDEPCGERFEGFLTEETVRDLEAKKRRAGGDGFEVAGTLLAGDQTSSPVIISSAPIFYPGEANARMAVVLPSSELEVTIGTRFLHGLSHALKTPAHSIVLLSQSFRRRKDHRNFEKNLALLNKEIKAYAGLIDNVLQVSELELKDVKVKRAALDLVQTLRVLARITARRAQDQGLSFQADIAKRLPLRVDLEMIRLVLNNLIDNALKYTDAGGLRLKAFEDADAIVIEIHDTGIGVREKDRRRMFQIFFRSEDPAVKVREGLGIGLHVSRRYVELHEGSLTHRLPNEGSRPHGTLSAQSNDAEAGEGPGSIFVVRLPKEEGQTP